MLRPDVFCPKDCLCQLFCIRVIFPAMAASDLCSVNMRKSDRSIVLEQ